jgi:AbrB family looped-hinge helix DNA binding protein
MTKPRASVKEHGKECEMELVKVKRNYQITIPQNLRRIIRLTVGDYVEVDIQDDTIVIRPVKVVHPDQEYFFTKEWQEKEAEADKDNAEGKVVGPFKNLDLQEIQEFLQEAEKIAKEENRSRSELIREALRRYIAERELRRLQRYGMKKAKELGLKEEDVQRFIDEYRAEPADA